MQTCHLSTYKAFIAAGRPYLPAIDATNRLMLPNFQTSPNTDAIKHKKRLVITSGVIYNRNQLVVAWSICQSCLGTRWRWLYWRGQTRITWHALSWDEKRAVIRAYVARQDAIPFFAPPTKNYRQWLAL